MGKSINAILLVLATVLAVPTVSYAAGLGTITVRSALGQPLDAEIEILSAQAGEDFQVRLATREAYAAAGVDLSPALQGARFAIERRDGKTLIRVRTTQPVNDPFFTVLVELQSPSGRLARQYTVLVDPAEYKTATAAAPATQAAVTAPAPAVVTPPAAPTPARAQVQTPKAAARAPAVAPQQPAPAVVAPAAPAAPATLTAQTPIAETAVIREPAPVAVVAPSAPVTAAAPTPAPAQPVATPAPGPVPASTPAASAPTPTTAPAQAAIATPASAPAPAEPMAAAPIPAPAPAGPKATETPVQPVAAAPAPVAVAPQPAAPSASPITAAPAPSIVAQPAPATQTAAAPIPAAPSAKAQSTEVSDAYQIKRGDTLGAIARKWKPEGVSHEQMLVGLFQANRGVFIRDNINLIRAGATIFIPGREDVLAINAGEAARQVRTHMAAFTRYRDTAHSAGTGSSGISQAQRDVVSRRVGVKKSTRAM